MAVRWGIGVQLAAVPRGFSGDAKPIGTQQQFAARGGRPGSGEGNPGGLAGAGSAGFAEGGFGSGGGAAAGSGAIGQYAGEFGGMILEQFQSRVASGKFGSALQNAPAGGSTDGGGGYDSGAAAIGLAGASSAGSAGAYSGRAMGMRGAYGGAGAAGGSGAKAGEEHISTGLTLIGVGTDKELKEKARQARVDVLAIFRVKIQVNRAGFVNNDCEVVLLDPIKNTELFKTGSLNNIKVQKDREQSKEDSVEKEVKKLFEYIDKDLTVTELPGALTPEIVKTRRVDNQLLAGSIDDPMAVLAEIRFYQRNKLLSDADAEAAIAKVAGDASAKTLLEGKEEDRKKVVEKWLPKG
jgi:hypothetical protein